MKQLNCWENFLRALFGDDDLFPFIDYHPFLKQDKAGNTQEWAVRQVLEMITPREKSVLTMRFNLDGQGYQTLEKVGGQFGVNRERIRQIEAKALRKCRHRVRSKFLKDFLYNPTDLDKKIANDRKRLAEKLSSFYPQKIALDIAVNIKRRYLQDALKSLEKGEREGVVLALTVSCRVEITKCFTCQTPIIPGWTFCSTECRKAYRTIILICDCGCGQQFTRSVSLTVYSLGKAGYQHVFLNRQHFGRWLSRTKKAGS